MFFVNSLTVIIKILQKNAYGNKKSLARARDFSVKFTPYSALLPHNLDIVRAEYMPWMDQYHTPPN